MTQSEVIEMARAAGIEVHDRKQEARIGMDVLIGADSTDKLMRLVALATAKERAACAQACDELTEAFHEEMQTGPLDEAGRMHREGSASGAASCAAAIRARGQEGA